ncbi:MAG TPA: hypothetical protein VHP33_23120 [Polyangiaceae bacterium]|nr:hypothetical protein [Polyangiaceae bacterium]
MKAKISKGRALWSAGMEEQREPCTCQPGWRWQAGMDNPVLLGGSLSAADPDVVAGVIRGAPASRGGGLRVVYEASPR